MENVEHENDVLAARLAATRGDDQGRSTRCGQRGGRAIGERPLPEKLDFDGMAPRSRNLIDHHGHGASSLQNFARPRQGTLGLRELHAERGTRPLPERIDGLQAQALGDDEKFDVARHGARGEIPVSSMGRRHDDAAALPKRVFPSRLGRRVDAHMAKGHVSARRYMQNLESRCPQRFVHRSGLGTGPIDPGREHRRLHVEATNP